MLHNALLDPYFLLEKQHGFHRECFPCLIKLDREAITVFESKTLKEHWIFP